MNEFISNKIAPFGVLRVGLNMSNFLLVSGEDKLGLTEGVSPDVGKKIAEELLKNRKQFLWISNNKNKIGHFIYKQKIESEELLKNESKKIIICAISEKQFTLPINTKFNMGKHHHYMFYQ